MTAYATRADIELRFGAENLRDWASLDGNVVESVVDDKVTEAIVEAQETIDGVLRKGPYDIPFTTVPGPIKRIAVVLAASWLHTSRGLVNIDGDDSPKSLGQAIVRLEEKAMQRLEDINAGRFSLDDDSETSMEPKIVTFDVATDEVLPVRPTTQSSFYSSG